MIQLTNKRANIALLIVHSTYTTEEGVRKDFHTCHQWTKAISVFYRIISLALCFTDTMPKKKGKKKNGDKGSEVAETKEKGPFIMPAPSNKESSLRQE